MSRFFRRLYQRLFPPRYPEYEEYRDEDDDLPTDSRGDGSRHHTARGAASGGGLSGGMPLDDTALKMRRLQLVAVLVVLLSIAVAVYLYVITGKPPDRPALGVLRGVAADEVLKSVEGELPSTPRQDSIDDIKRWAADMERRAERGTTDSAVPLRPEQPPYYGQGFDANRLLDLPIVPVESMETEAATPARSVTPTEVVTPVRSSPPPQSVAIPPSLDSPVRPYQRRSLDPVRYDPQNVEPY